MRYVLSMPDADSFGAMLRRIRMSAGLTQERLAESSGISAAGVAALESGRRKVPRAHTVNLLCDALFVSSEQRAALIAAATGVGLGPGWPTPVKDNGNERPISPGAPRRAVQQSFVGRCDELNALRKAWESRTRVTVVFGEAGVGKSYLAEQLAADLAQRGVAVLEGRSTSQQLGVFEAFIEPVRTALKRYTDGVPPHLRDLGRLIPGLLDAESDILVPSRSDPAIERRLLFENVGSLLASNGPTLLILDDLHWADPGTLALLTFLAAHEQLPDLMIVGTVRSTDLTTSTSAVIAELRRYGPVQRLQLVGLNHAELAELVSEVAGPEVSDALIKMVSDSTNGNPLFIRELTEHLLHQGPGAGGETRIPDGIRDTIKLRVAGLSLEGQALLRAGAVLGPTFDLALAGQLVGLEGEVLLSALEDALLSGVIVERSASIAAFSHGLVATAIYEGTTKSRRLQLHRLAATLLDALCPSTSGEIVNLARHWSIVAEEDPTARSTASRWLVRAGDAALASASIDEAITRYQNAITGWEEPTGEFADILVRLGSALTTNGRVADGKQHLRRALQVANQAGDAFAFARAALELSATVPYTHSDPERIAELELAIVKLGPTEMVMRPAVLATLRRQLGWVNTPEADQRRIELASLLADVVADPEVSEDLLIALGSLRDTMVLDDPIPMGRLARYVIRVAQARQDLPVLAIAWHRQAFSALELGEADLFRTAVAEYRGIAERLRRPYESAVAANMTAAVAQIEGRNDDAEAAGQESLAYAATIEDANFSWIYFANSGFRAFDAGNGSATLELMRAVRADFANLATFEAALAAIAVETGAHAFANELFDEQVGHEGENLDRNWSYLGIERLPVVGILAWGAWAARDVKRSMILRDRLERIASFGVRAVRVGPVSAWVGPVDHHLGALSRVLGDFDRADHHLTGALDVETAMNSRPFAIRTMMELAVVASERCGSNSAAHAANWRGKAEAIAEKFGLESILLTGPSVDSGPSKDS